MCRAALCSPQPLDLQGFPTGKQRGFHSDLLTSTGLLSGSTARSCKKPQRKPQAVNRGKPQANHTKLKTAWRESMLSCWQPSLLLLGTEHTLFKFIYATQFNNKFIQTEKSSENWRAGKLVGLVLFHPPKHWTQGLITLSSKTPAGTSGSHLHYQLHRTSRITNELLCPHSTLAWKILDEALSNTHAEHFPFFLN